MNFSSKLFYRWLPSMKAGRWRLLIAASLLLVGLVAFNVLSSVLPLRLDITEGRVFTLSEGSRQLLANLEHPITLRFYHSQSLENIPIPLQTHARRIRGLLRTYQSHSKGKVKVELIDPKPDTQEEEWALRYGLTPSQSPAGNRLFFGLVVLQQQREAVLPFLDPRRESSLEYDISETIVRVTRESLPRVMVVSFLPVAGVNYGAGLPALNKPAWAFISELSKNYQVENIRAGDLMVAPQDVDLMLVIHPKSESMSPRSLYAIDQYLLAGGKLMVLLDPLSTKDLSGQPGFNTQPSSTLSPLLNAWDVEYSSTHLLGDVSLGTPVRTPQGVLNYPFWISLGSKQMNKEEPLTAQLENMLLVHSGSFSLKKGSSHRLVPLLESSDNTGRVQVASFRLQNPLAQTRLLRTDGKKRVLAALLSGEFKTAYPDGPPDLRPGERSRRDDAPPKLPPHRAKAEAETSILLVGDTDFISDEYSVQRAQFLGNVFLQPLNDNLNFFLNAVEWLSGGQELIAIRSRGKTTRPFTRLVNLQVRAARRFQEQENLLNVRLAEVRDRLKQLQESQSDSALLDKAQEKEINRFRQEEQKTRRALREVRKLLREDIERLGVWLLAFNLLPVPVMVGGFGFWFIYRRTRRSEQMGTKKRS